MFRETTLLSNVSTSVSNSSPLKFLKMSKQKVINYRGEYWSEFENDDVVIATNGTFLIKKTDLGNFSILIQKHDGYIREILEYKGLENFCLKDELKIPKIPYKFLEDLVLMDLYVMETMNDSEFFADIIYDKKKQQFEIYIPKQTISGASVSFEEFIETEDKILVLDHHSHNKMGAFFSATDDNNDKNYPFKISMVLGELKSVTNFRYSIRKCAYGLYEQCDLDLIFEMKQPELDPKYISEINKNVTTKTVSLNRIDVNSRTSNNCLDQHIVDVNLKLYLGERLIFNEKVSVNAILLTVHDSDIYKFDKIRTHVGELYSIDEILEQIESELDYNVTMFNHIPHTVEIHL